MENENFTLITAPPKFGKSTIINMMRRFLEIEVNREGKPITKENFLDERVTDTKNYDLFKKHDLAINRFPDCFSEHFGRTPVINVDLKLDSDVIECFHDAVRVVKEVIHRSFKDHEYLIYSDLLTEDHRNYVQMWCDDHSYKTMIDTLYVSHALQSLSQYLHAHFGRRVFVFVDNYDYIIRIAMYKVKDEPEMTKIVKYTIAIIKDVLKDNDNNVRGAFLTGISDFPFLNKTDFNDCYTYPFLGDHRFFEYYGFTREEIVRLFAKSKIYLDSQKFASYYNGYQTIEGNAIYNMFSVLGFLKTGLYGSYFAASTFPTHLKRLLSAVSIESALENLIENKTLAMELPSNTKIGDYMNLYKSNLESYSENEVPSIFLNNLFEWGFLSYDPLQESFLNNLVVLRNFVGVKLPNNETKEYLEKQIKANN